MKATAIAPANIAFIKYWGKKDEALRLPLNSSISMNLSNCLTTTTVEFSEKYKKDEVIFLPSVILGSDSDSRMASGQARMTGQIGQRIVRHLDRIRKIANIKLFAKVVTKNNFPLSAGIASSASGFAALTVAAGCMASGLQVPRVILGSDSDSRIDSGQARMTKKSISEKELTILARIGSGSAYRSIPDGFVEWTEGSNNETSFAHSLYPANYWDLRDIILIVSNTSKKVGSTAGMENVWTSPLMEKRLRDLPERIKKVKAALKDKNFTLLGKTIGEECLNMHKVMQTQKPPLYYWTDETIKIMDSVRKWRNQGIAVYFTIDAGPNVHLICEGKNENEVVSFAKKIKGVEQIIINKPAVGARLSEKDLF